MRGGAPAQARAALAWRRRQREGSMWPRAPRAVRRLPRREDRNADAVSSGVCPVPSVSVPPRHQQEDTPAKSMAPGNGV